MTRPPTDEEFAELVHACWASLYRTAYLMLGDRADAEDLVQTALAKTYANWRKVRNIEAAPGYARTTLVNTAASWFRKKGWRNERPTEVLPESAHASRLETDLSDRRTVIDALGTPAPAAAGGRRTPLLRGPQRRAGGTRPRHHGGHREVPDLGSAVEASSAARRQRHPGRSEQ